MVRLILLLPLLLVLACSSPEPLAGTGIRVGLDGSIATLDPRLAVEARAARISPLIYSSLLKLDETGRLVPDLVRSWSQPDARTYLFRLNRGVYFHDGREVTADDVRATFAFIMDPRNSSPKGGSYKPVKRIEVIDQYTVKFCLRDISVSFPYALTVGIVPQGSPGGLKSPPVGSGPFRLKHWRPGEEVVLVATLFNLQEPRGGIGKNPELNPVESRLPPEICWVGDQHNLLARSPVLEAKRP